MCMKWGCGRPIGGLLEGPPQAIAGRPAQPGLGRRLSLHSDHTVDYFSFPLLAATTPPAFGPVGVYGPGPAGEVSLLPDAPVLAPFTVLETSDLKVTAILVPHGNVFPASAKHASVRASTSRISPARWRGRALNAVLTPSGGS